MQEIVGTSRRYYFHSHICRFPLHSIPRYSKIEPDLYVLEQRKENPGIPNNFYWFSLNYSLSTFISCISSYIYKIICYMRNEFYIMLNN